MPFIQTQHLTKQYSNDGVMTLVLHDVTLNIDVGEFVAIMGPSGSGKSTLMHILGFLDTASSGKYFYKGKDVSSLSSDELAFFRNREVGFIFQAFHLLARTSVLENVMLPLMYDTTHSLTRKEREGIATVVLESVGLGHRLKHFSNQLSGGEKQRVAIARALVNDPSIIFADEPTGNLDSKSGKQVMEILQRLNDHGRTIILVTHEKYTSEHAKRIVRLMDGVIISDDAVEKRILAEGVQELLK